MARLVGSVVVTILLAMALLGCGGGKTNPLSQPDYPPTGTVEGRLVVPNSGRQAPVMSRFTVRVHGTEERIQWRAQVRTEGFFRIENVPAGEQTITLEDPQSGWGAVLVVFIRPGQVVNVGEVEPTPLGQIAGMVTELGTGKPVARARIVARPVESSDEPLSQLPLRPLFSTITNQQGAYSLLVPEGTYLVEAYHPSYEPTASTASVQVGRTTALDFQLAPRQDLGTLFGTVTAVVNGAQVPVPGALVALVPQGISLPEPPLTPLEMTVGEVVKALQNPVKGSGQVPRYGRRPLFTFTRADGSYEITGIPAGTYLAVALKRGYGRDEKTVTVEANQRVQADFVLQATWGVVKGTVTDGETGQPIAGALVIAVRKGDPWWDWDEWRPLAFARSNRPAWHRPKGAPAGGASPSIGQPPMFPVLPPIVPPVRAGTVTDREGNYQLLLPPGDYFISATADGYDWQAQEVDGLQSGQTVVVDFALIKMQADEGDWESLEVTLSVPASVKQGTPVPLQLTVRNIGDQVLTLEFGLPEADFLVTTEDGREVWRWSHGKAFPAILQQIVLRPGEVRRFREVWRQVDNNGRRVPAGNYQVVGIFASRLQTDPQPLSIVP